MKEIINLGTSYMNAYALPLSEGYLLVDTGYPFDYKKFIKAAKKKKVALEDIRYIVLTHVHADHAGFLQRLLKQTKAKLIYLPEEKERLASGVNVKDVYIAGLGNLFTSKISAAMPMMQTFEPVDVTEALDAKEQPLLKEGIRFFVLHGHTDNDLCFAVEDKLFVGDICMNGAGSSYHSPLWIEDNEKLVESWKEIVKMDATTLYPAHGKPFAKGELEKYIPTQEKKKIYKLYK